jgi:hypothetical protein
VWFASWASVGFVVLGPWDVAPVVGGWSGSVSSVRVALVSVWPFAFTSLFVQAEVLPGGDMHEGVGGVALAEEDGFAWPLGGSRLETHGCPVTVGCFLLTNALVFLLGVLGEEMFVAVNFLHPLHCNVGGC